MVQLPNDSFTQSENPTAKDATSGPHTLSNLANLALLSIILPTLNKHSTKTILDFYHPLSNPAKGLNTALKDAAKSMQTQAHTEQELEYDAMKRQDEQIQDQDVGRDEMSSSASADGEEDEV